MKITSRRNFEHELFQMKNFAELLVQFEVARWVSEIYFDSDSSICFVDVQSQVAEGSWIFNKIKELAEQSITQFEMFGVIYHGIESA